MVRRNKKLEKKIALERVKTLFKESELVFGKDDKLADRYVNLARKIAMKVNLKFPKDLKRKFCNHCYCYLKPGVNCRVRIREKMVVYYCLKCKKFMRFRIK